MRLFINDTAFQHCSHSVAGQFSEKVEWVRNATCGTTDPYFHFYTNEQCFNPLVGSYLPIKHVAWLIESCGIIPEIYNNFHLVANKFDIILTHSSKLLNQYSNSKWIFGGGSWISGKLGGGEEKIYTKTRFCSMVSSDKTMCQLHIDRLNVINHLEAEKHRIDSKFSVDLFGTWNGNKDWRQIIHSLADYKYSIIMENYIDDAFWTEKLTNCFMTATIPIYYGARKIDDYFASNGIIKFSSFDELRHILTNISEEDYNSRIDAIRYNFEEAKKYRLMENQIYDMITNGII